MRCLEKVKANSVWHDANPDLLLPKCRGRHVAIADGRGLGGFGDFDEGVDATLAEGRFDEGEVASAAMPRRGSLHCGISRRFFIGGAVAFGAFGGNRVVRAAGNALAGGPNVTFGVVSDIHVTKVGEGEKMEAWGNNLTFRHTLEWFRDQGVDAVLIAGDMADHGMVGQMEAVAQAWYAVFPDDRYPDGRPVVNWRVGPFCICFTVYA